MLKRPSEQRLTLEERIAVVVAIAVSIAAHAAIFFFGGGITQLMQEEQKRERLMVVRRVREVAPPPEMRVRIPDPRRVQVPQGPAPEGAPGGASPKPEPKPSAGGTPPPPKAEITPKPEEDLQESQQQTQVPEPTEAKKSEEVGASSVSVVTDLPSASFTLSGPAEYRGSGTFWIRRGAPAGTYRIVFVPVPGFGSPPPQFKDLPENGQIVFVGKYRRSTEISVASNNPAAQFTVFRPDGRPIDLPQSGRVLVDDLPPGTYTAVFKDIPGQITPRPVSRTLSPGGALSFHGEYRAATGGGGGGTGGTGGTGTGVGEGSGTGRGSRGSGSGAGGGGGGGGGRGGPPIARVPGPEEGTLDRRVQLVVKSYPPTDIEEDHDPIDYPEMIIRKSSFQQGWCQVYLVLGISDDGEVNSVTVERPRPAERAQYEALISAVEKSVRAWDYDSVAAEVHVDVRFYVE